MGLTEEQKQLVLSDWEVVENNSMEVGQQIFLKLFELHPTWVKMFTNLDDLPINQLKDSDALKAHGSGVVGLLGRYMKCLKSGEMRVLNRLVQGTAKRHHKYGTTAEHFIALRDEVMPATLKKCLPNFDGQHAEAWKELMQFVTEGILDTLKEIGAK